MKKVCVILSILALFLTATVPAFASDTTSTETSTETSTDTARIRKRLAEPAREWPPVLTRLPGYDPKGCWTRRPTRKGYPR